MVPDKARWPEVIVITGPTASGKSALAIELAQALGAEIISADSRQIYRGMPITTASPSVEERKGVKHHLLEFLDINDYYSAAAFEKDALGIIKNAADKGAKHIIVCGGSMMYIDALLYGLDDLPAINAEVRTRVKELMNTIGLPGLVAYLSNLDPMAIQRIDMNNPRRVMHAVELCLQTGRPISEIFGTTQTCRQRPFNYRKYALNVVRTELFERINKRVDLMVGLGMENEARHFYHMRHLNSLNTIGFKEWFAHFDGLMDRDTTISRIAKNTRVYAKKQMTWLASQHDVTFLDRKSALNSILKVC